jgi:hypothetical protein
VRSQPFSWASVRREAQVCAGVLAAFAAWELSLHPIAGQLRVPPRPHVECDSLDAHVIETRQTEEGIALARYSSCGARLTGHATAPSAPYVVLLGDSYVAAREVNDGETMGARLENIARAAKQPVNVRQYGWGGASPAQYVVAANAVLARWHPNRVVVVLSDDDLGANTVAGMPPRLRVLADGRIEIDSAGMADPGVRPAPRLALLALIERRWAMIVARAPGIVRQAVGPLDAAPQGLIDEKNLPEIPDVVVRALSGAFGGVERSRLLIVYLADVRVTGGEAASLPESRLLQSCAERGVSCLSTRRAMLDARRAGTAVRGFSTTVAGLGHLNAEGHLLVAREIWTALRAHD